MFSNFAPHFFTESIHERNMEKSFKPFRGDLPCAPASNPGNFPIFSPWEANPIPWCPLCIIYTPLAVGHRSIQQQRQGVSFGTDYIHYVILKQNLFHIACHWSRFFSNMGWSTKYDYSIRASMVKIYEN